MKTFTNLKRCFVLIFATLLLVTTCILPANADNVAKSADKNTKYSYMNVPSDYELVATSENLELYVDYNSGYFLVKNTDNGYIWKSVPDDIEYDSYTVGDDRDSAQSIVSFSYLLVEEEASVTSPSNVFSYNAENVDVTKIDDGFRVEYLLKVNVTETQKTEDEESESEETEEIEEVEEYGDITLPVEIKLNNGHLDASIILEDVKYDSRVIICEYNLLPYFGAASWTDEGYIFVPDGSGALINFKGHEYTETSYSAPVYGEDISSYTELESKQSEAVRMPVFGLKNGDNAFVGIITDGDTTANIKANPTNKNFGHSKASASFQTRVQNGLMMFKGAYYQKQIYKFSYLSESLKNLKVCYYLLSGDDADYIGMANTYREYLIDNGMLNKNVSEPTLNIDTYGAIDVKANFLGFNYRKLESLTSYSEAVKMVEALNKEGIDDISLRYMGWSNNGVTNKKAVNKPKILGVLGGKSDYNDMIESLEKLNTKIYPDSDLLYFTKGTKKSAAKTVFSQIFYKYQYLRSVYVFDLEGNKEMLLNPNLIKENSEKFFNKYQNISNTSNISLSTLTNTVYSSLDRNEQYTKYETISMIEDTLKRATDAKLNIVGENANQYALKYVSKIYKSPMYSSAYDIFESEIPFYQIVLHGYIGMTGNPMVQSTDIDIMYLKCVEAGIELLWNGIYEDSAQLSTTNYDDLYGSTYTLWIKDAAERYQKYQPLLKKIYDAQIVNHDEILDDVTVTTYSNGIKVYVNFTDEDVEINGVKVAAKNFEYKEG